MVVLASEEICDPGASSPTRAGAARAAGERGPLVAAVTAAAIVDCEGRSTRDVNLAIKRRSPTGRHTSRSSIRRPATRSRWRHQGRRDPGRFTGRSGWYTAGMNDGPHVVVQGNCGWAMGECHDAAGRSRCWVTRAPGPPRRSAGGLVYVPGDTGARAGIAMKGGTLVVGGRRRLHDRVHDAGGHLIVLRRRRGRDRRLDVRGTIFVGGSVASRAPTPR